MFWPYSLKYTEDIPEGFGGYARAWFIRIRPKYQNDVGLLEHEKEHVRQFFCTCGMHGSLYLLFSSYQKYAEVRAYRIQYKINPENLEDFVRFLTDGRYHFTMMANEARNLLLK